MEGISIQVDHWVWWIFAVVMIILEVFAPGAIFLWMGIAAVVVGGLLYLAPNLIIEYQLLLFSLLSIVAIIGWRLYLKSHPQESDSPGLNQRNNQYVGRLFTLEHPIVDGYGKVRVDDSTWKIEGPDVPAGTQVRITGTQGVVLKAEPVERQ